jgi:hypothetical protein
LLAIPALYFVLLAFNVPPRVLAASLLFMVLFFAFFFALPPLPVWLSLALLVLSHKVQAWSHKLYRAERDMTEYNKKYKKGLVLFVLLSLYELPILLNYLVFDRKNWTRPTPAPTVPPGERVPALPPDVSTGDHASARKSSPQASSHV